jgi:hypothetical protein
VNWECRVSTGTRSSAINRDSTRAPPDLPLRLCQVSGHRYSLLDRPKVPLTSDPIGSTVPDQSGDVVAPSGGCGGSRPVPGDWKEERPWSLARFGS